LKERTFKLKMISFYMFCPWDE